MNAPACQQSEPTTALYLLGFAPPTADEVRARIALSFNPLQCLSIPGVDIWYVVVDRSEFEGATGERNLADLAWLGPRVVAHQMGVQWIADAIPFYPAHFGTLFTHPAKLIELAEANLQTLSDFFAGEARHIELGIKCFVNWERAVEQYQLAHQDTSPATVGTGVNYLLKKKMIRARDTAVQGWIQNIISLFRAELKTLTVRMCERKVVAGDQSSGHECLANWSLLVDPARQVEVHAWIKQAAQAAHLPEELFNLQLTGPWPLYSFAPPLVNPAPQCLHSTELRSAG